VNNYLIFPCRKIGDALGYFSVGLQRADINSLPADKSISATSFRQHIQNQINEVGAIYSRFVLTTDNH
jgi:hypothetical protein